MRQQLLEAHRSAAAYYRQQLRDEPDGWAAQHLRERGLGDVLSDRSSWRVGYAPEGWSRLVNHLRKAGFSDKVMVDGGLASVSGNGYLLDRFRDRIVFAARYAALRTVGFVGRSSGRRLRYLNTPNTHI
jgi:DNA primase